MSWRKSTQVLDKELLFLVQGHDSRNRESFYYVLVEKMKKDIFLKNIKGGGDQITDLNKYGTILISGFGPAPTQDAKKYLKNEFNLDVQ